jgi:KUP system potassium uptake protein
MQHPQSGQPHAKPHTNPRAFWPLYVGAMGVVFGDIGTSPLYTLRECLQVAGGATPANIMGVLSLLCWSLMLVVTVKYTAIILKADNRGEGGILALTALAYDQFASAGFQKLVLMLGLLGAALFYGDALITPAISVLSAVEGLKVVSPTLQPWVQPLSLVVLFLLFGAQAKGTGQMGAWFGPVMLTWFGVLAVFGLAGIAANPTILAALNPLHALSFIGYNPMLALLVMGAVILAVTGAEALYADLGHYGRRPIQWAWLTCAGPCLLLNYFGQGALLLTTPEAIKNPFYLLVPPALLWPTVALATAATVIASQAVISGAFSLTNQAMQLGYLPRMVVRHTSQHHAGQIYLPHVNWLLLAGVVLLVLTFGTSSALAGAYGIAVAGTMLTTSLLGAIVLRRRNGWPVAAVALFAAVFVPLDVAFLVANFHKIPEGGWLPLALGLALWWLMHTWLKGRKASQAMVQSHNPLLEGFLHKLDATLPHVTRTAVFMTSDLNHVPPALMYNLTHNGVWHTQIIIMKISRARVPRYPAAEKIRVHHLPHGVSTVQATYGFMEQPNIPHLLTQLPQHGLEIRHPEHLSYFLSTHTYVPSAHKALNGWEERAFLLMDKLAVNAVTFFRLPRKQVIELGNHIEI